MAKTTNQLLAEALDEANNSAKENIINSKGLKPKQQALLVKQGYLKRIIKGWYLLDADLSSNTAGSSALWLESIWSFIGQYLYLRFKNNYWLSSESSLDIHTANNSIPSQIVVFTKNGTEDIVQLPNNMSILVTSSKSKPKNLIVNKGIQIFPLETALANSVPASFRKHPLSMQVALKNAKLEKLSEALLNSKNMASAGRLIGAYASLEMRAESKKLQVVMSGVFQTIKIIDPFETTPVILHHGKKEAASASRIRLMWQQMRQAIIDGFDDENSEDNFYSRPLQKTLEKVNDLYLHDAYNSLSIEGYKVTPELIEKVKSGDWLPDANHIDGELKNALAARGYFDAFNDVKASLTEAHNKEDLRYLVDVGITQWHTSLFKPCVTAGLISELDLVGYRKGPIYIRGSRHVPPASEQLMDCMSALKECIVNEESFAVKAILGHLFFGYIHPYFDGNGRTARFLMNFLFILGGYSWVVIKQETRKGYLDALESASVSKDIMPFVEFILDTIRNSELDKTIKLL